MIQLPEVDWEKQLVSLLVIWHDEYGDKILSMIKPEMFKSETNLAIYNRVLELRDQGKPVDLQNIFVKEHVLRILESETEINSPYLNIAKWIRRVRDDWQNRLRVELGERLKADRMEPSEAFALMDDFREKVQIDPDKGLFSMQELAELYGTKEQFEEMQNGFVHIGLSGFDRNITIKAGDFVTLAGRPGMGKTDFSLMMALNLAKQGVPVGIVSLEMRAQYLFKRLCQSEWNTVRDDFNGINVSPSDQLEAGASLVANLPIYVSDSSRQNVHSLRTIAKRLVRENGVKLLIIDYLTLLESPKAENRNQEVTKMSREIKLSALECGIPFLVLSQLSRAVEMRKDKRPQLSDLRESGSVEQDSDIVLFLYRPAYYEIEKNEAGEDTTNYLELISGKQREGAVGRIPFYYDPAKKVLKDWAGGAMEAPIQSEYAPF